MLLLVVDDVLWIVLIDCFKCFGTCSTKLIQSKLRAVFLIIIDYFIMKALTLSAGVGATQYAALCSV